MLLQAGQGQVGTGLTVAILFLTLLFFLLPAAFIVADQLQRRDKTEAKATHRSKPRSVRDPSKYLVIRESKEGHPFRHERPPGQHAFLPNDTKAKQGLDHRGHLVLGDRSSIEGDVRVIGSLAIGNAAEVMGSVKVDGDLYIAGSALVGGTGHVQGDVYMEPWARAMRIEASGEVHIDSGVEVPNGIRTSGLRRVSTIERGSGSRSLERPRSIL